MKTIKTITKLESNLAKGHVTDRSRTSRTTVQIYLTGLLTPAVANARVRRKALGRRTMRRAAPDDADRPIRPYVSPQIAPFREGYDPHI